MVSKWFGRSQKPIPFPDPQQQVSARLSSVRLILSPPNMPSIASLRFAISVSTNKLRRVSSVIRFLE